MLRIRLTSTGCRNHIKHRIVVMDTRNQRDGKAVAYIGHYLPEGKRDSKKYSSKVVPSEFKINMNLVKFWRDRGAQVNPSVIKRMDSESLKLYNQILDGSYVMHSNNIDQPELQPQDMESAVE